LNGGRGQFDDSSVHFFPNNFKSRANREDPVRRGAAGGPLVVLKIGSASVFRLISLDQPEVGTSRRTVRRAGSRRAMAHSQVAHIER
jgi:hypothetical protein